MFATRSSSFEDGEGIFRGGAWQWLISTRKLAKKNRIYLGKQRLILINLLVNVLLLSVNYNT